MSLRTLQMTVEGKAPLLCSNVAYCDPLGDYQHKKEFFTDKKGKAKTTGVHQAVRTLDWLFSGYWRNEGVVEVDESENAVGFDGWSDPYLPGANLQRCLRNAATKWKLGKDILRSVIVYNNPDIMYDGPRNAHELYNCRSPKFQLCSFTGRGVWVNRLMIPVWSATFELTLDDEIMGFDQFRRIADMAGKSEGLGTWRPRYGRFGVAALEVIDEA